ncbi:MAG: hypothetical protein ABEI32_13115 [Halothece sp.]
MSWKRFKLMILALLATVLIVGSDVAVADNDETKDVVRIGTNVTVAENQVFTEAVAIGGSVTVLEGGQLKLPL